VLWRAPRAEPAHVGTEVGRVSLTLLGGAALVGGAFVNGGVSAVFVL
jgi:hypothetical protein